MQAQIQALLAGGTVARGTGGGVLRSLMVDFIFLLAFYFIFFFSFFVYFLFLEQLGLGLIGHAVTSVTT